MKIYVNNVERSTVKVGSRQVLYLMPFHTYDIRLAPAKNALLDYESNNKRVTLYPGNVAKLHWDINKFYVVSARIVTADDQPLVDAILQESRAQVITDKNGRMQAEMSAPKVLTFDTGNGGSCRVILPVATATNGVLLYKEGLRCLTSY
jgi:outer membrane usher protein FimD/PapC